MAKMHWLLISVSTVGFLLLWGCSAAGTGGSQSTPLGDFASQAGANVGTAGVPESFDDPLQSGGSDAVTGVTSTETEIAGVAWLADDECAGKMVTISRNPINVIMVVDRSTTMVMSGFGNYPSRWEALREALMGDPDGLVRQYENIVRFGYEGFTGYPPTDFTGMPCPDLKSVPHEMMNYDTIKPVYDESRPAGFGAGAIGQTPTGEALTVIIDNLEKLLVATLDVQAGGPFVILLATDGEPDTCAAPNVDGSPEATRIVEEQVARAFGLGINTYVLSVGADTSDAHLQAVANAGTGLNDAPFWKADNDQGLKDALSEIIGAALSCELELDGEIADVSMACQEGTVMINGEPVLCDGSGNGWQVVDSTHIELVGDACITVKSSPSVMLEARFPCGVIIG